MSIALGCVVKWWHNSQSSLHFCLLWVRYDLFENNVICNVLIVWKKFFGIICYIFTQPIYLYIDIGWVLLTVFRLDIHVTYIYNNDIGCVIIYIRLGIPLALKVWILIPILIFVLFYFQTIFSLQYSARTMLEVRTMGSCLSKNWLLNLKPTLLIANCHLPCRKLQ